MPENIRAYHNLSLLHNQNNDYNNAEKTLIEGLEIDATNESLLYALAYHYSNTNQTEKAINILKKLIELYPNNSQYISFLNNLKSKS